MSANLPKQRVTLYAEPTPNTYAGGSYYPTSYTITSVPAGSALLGKDPTKVNQSAQDVPRFEFTPDVGGTYTLQSLRGAEDRKRIPFRGSRVITVAERLTRTVEAGSSSGNDRAKCVLYLQDGVVLKTSKAEHGDDSPRLDLQSSSSKGQMAAADKRVIDAVAALAGMTASQVQSTGFPALTTAWQAALASPDPDSAQVDPGAVALVNSGWEKG
jgi:hypothetical protein